jgi:hypothetical protein
MKRFELNVIPVDKIILKWPILATGHYLTLVPKVFSLCGLRPSSMNQDELAGN